MERIEVTQAVVRELLDYDPTSGGFVWKTRNERWFSEGRDMKAWNAHYAGRHAGSKMGIGYIEIAIQDKRYRAHRLAWLYIHGMWPQTDIDHINGDRADNRIENLRLASKSENGRNQGLPRHNTSGVMGVHWMPRPKRWQARIMVKGKRIHLGYFTNFDDAVKVRLSAEQRFNYHSNHGKRPSFTA